MYLVTELHNKISSFSSSYTITDVYISVSATYTHQKHAIVFTYLLVELHQKISLEPKTVSSQLGTTYIDR